MFDDLVFKLAGEFRAIAQVVGDKTPASAWKPGQMLVNVESGHIYRLLQPAGAEGWWFEYWDGSGWKKFGITGPFTRSYVPYPRVGDWVRCTRTGIVFKVNEADGRIVSGHDDTERDIADLEPASPPFGQATDKTTQALDRMLLNKAIAANEPSTPALEGEHWKYHESIVANDGSYISQCLLELRDQVRLLKERK